MTTTPSKLTITDATPALVRAVYLDRYPVVVNCPGCAVPIRQPKATPFEAKENWCPTCGGTARIATPSEPDTAEAYTTAVRVASEAR